MITKEQLIEIVLEILTPDQMKILNDRLQLVHENMTSTKAAETVDVNTSTPKRVVNEDFTVNRNNGKDGRVSVAVSAGENKWSDSGEERDDFDEKVQRKYTPRVRPKAVMQTVVCSVCQKAQEIPPGLVRRGSYYRCENCVGGGRR